ncbi:MAG TPA: pirin family protein, partial [Planctomycetota bacterium]
GHSDMEILTIVLEGALRHRDSLGTTSVIRPGEVQRMTAGTGVVHSEMNESRTEPVHFLQIWIHPEREGLKPGYEQKSFPDGERGDRFRLVASRDGREGSVTIHQDVSVCLARLSPGEEVSRALKPGRHAWVQAIRGKFDLNGANFEAGDGAAVSGEKSLRFRAREEAEILLFDLA